MPGLRWSGAAGSAALTRAVIEDLLGWQLDQAKRAEAVSCTKVLGVTVAVAEGECAQARRVPVRHYAAPGPVYCRQDQSLVFSIDGERAAKWLALVQEALASGRLAPSKAAKLAGKLSWGASAVFGHGCRCFLAPLYHHAHQKQWELSRRAKAALRWWAEFLPKAPQCRIPLGPEAPRPRVLVYSDATGGGRPPHRPAARSGRAGVRRAPSCQAGLGHSGARVAMLRGGRRPGEAEEVGATAAYPGTPLQAARRT